MSVQMQIFWSFVNKFILVNKTTSWRPKNTTGERSSYVDVLSSRVLKQSLKVWLSTVLFNPSSKYRVRQNGKSVTYLLPIPKQAWPVVALEELKRSTSQVEELASIKRKRNEREKKCHEKLQSQFDTSQIWSKSRPKLFFLLLILLVEAENFNVHHLEQLIIIMKNGSRSFIICWWLSSAGQESDQRFWKVGLEPSPSRGTTTLNIQPELQWNGLDKADWGSRMH